MFAKEALTIHAETGATAAATDTVDSENTSEIRTMREDTERDWDRP